MGKDGTLTGGKRGERDGTLRDDEEVMVGIGLEKVFQQMILRRV